MTKIISVQRVPNPVGDVIFVHGLGGDALDTWNLSSENSWKKWIGANRPDLNVWSIAYRVDASDWTGGAMPLSDRALNVLAMIDNKGIAARPLVFICHSMGGLLIKELLRHALTVTSRFRFVAENTKAIVFFATPHTGSAIADIARYFNFVLRASVAIGEMTAHHSGLRQLNLWYRNNYSALGLKSCIFFETGETSGVRVVDETSADPGIPQVSPIGIDADHISITKPQSYVDVVVGQTLKTIDEAIPSEKYRYDPDLDMGEANASPQTPITPITRKPANWRGRFKVALIGLSAALALALSVYLARLVWQSFRPTASSVRVDSEMYVGHWIGFPQIVMRFTIDNPTSSAMPFFFKSGKLIAPNNDKQIVLNLDVILSCNDSVPTTPTIQVESRQTMKCIYSFLPYFDLGALTPQLNQVLAQKGGFGTGPRDGLIEPPLLGQVKDAALRNFQWRVGQWEVRLEYSYGTQSASLRTHFDIRQSDIDRMKAVLAYYGAGYGVYAPWRNWTPDRNQPMPQVEAKPVPTP